jgi:hypothetical protein
VKTTLFAFLSVASAFIVILSQAQDRPSGKAAKGMELYSWLDSNKSLIFALVPGTNRLKTETEIKEKRNQIASVRELEKRFLLLSEGEHVGWDHGNQKHGFAYPNRKTMDDVAASARKAKIELHVENQTR